MDRIRSYPTNKIGRDIIFGDIHGYFDIASTVLRSLRLKQGDRVFTVGDLVNRGPHPLKTFQKFWMSSVRGNHEQLILSYSKGHIKEKKLLSCGGEWFTKLSSNVRKEIVSCIQRMPTVITIGDKNPVVLAHACLPAPWKIAEKKIKESSSFRERIHCEHGFYKNSSKELIKETCKGVSSIIVGHDIVPEITVIENTIYQLDTGVYKTGTLSYAIIEKGNVKTFSFQTLSV